MLFAISLIFLSFLTIPSLFINKISSLQSLYNKVETYKGVIGTFFCALGLIRTFQTIIHGNFNLITLGATLCMSVLGFLLGFQLIAKSIFANNEEAKEKIRAIYFKLVGYERILSFLALGLGIWIIVQKY